MIKNELAKVVKTDGDERRQARRTNLYIELLLMIYQEGLMEH